MRFIFSIFLYFLLSGNLYAEGTCPPGLYPIGGQGASGCAPIPQNGAGTTTGAPRPTGKWIKTWGAIALSKSGPSGAASGKLTKREAVNSAMEMCALKASDCEVKSTYKNGCMAMSQVVDGGVYVFQGGGSIKDSEINANNTCSNLSGKKCSIVYSNCSDPIFKKF
ncbi:DUF4189 domain-containing protein [Xanthomonas cannabis]|uniref:DUF4189 domain-containing protein n=1 Tax=Xanthomonas cannabis TaxID=1885674 RepID=UPI000575BFB5|nr:hypothetical protein OZ13_07290 [Xanthomonas cannabis pv. cannabis]